jgi:hypothetical protein
LILAFEQAFTLEALTVAGASRWVAVPRVDA